MAYLDAASTEPLHPSARETLLAAMDAGWADPARLYREARQAKLLLDYILSSEGQIAFARGGLTAYRPDVAEQAPLHLAQVSKAAGGDDKLIFVRPDAEIADQAKHDEFIARWQKAFQIEP